MNQLLKARTSHLLLGLVLFLALILAAYYMPWLSNKSSFYILDFTFWWHPFFKRITDAVQHGHLALWDPYILCGVPVLAVSTPTIFYPPSLIFCFTNFNTAMAAVLLIHQIAAGAGTFLLVTGFGWAPAAALLAGSSFALCGYMFSLQTNMTLQGTAAWFPFCFWALRQINKEAPLRKRLSFAMLSSLFVYLMVSAGMPEIFLPSLIFFGFYSLYCGKREGAILGSATCLRLSALAIGCLLSMPAIWPALDCSRLSIRAAGLSLDEIFTWSASWYDLVCLWLAQPLGDMQMLDNPFNTFFPVKAHSMSFLASSFVSPVILTLAIWGALSASWREKAWLLLALVISLLATLGCNTPVAPFVLSIIPFHMLRYPIKLMFFPSFCLILLAGLGMSTALNNAESTRRGTLIASAWWVISAVIGLLLYFALPTALLWGNSTPQNLSIAATGALAASTLLAAIEGALVCFMGWSLGKRIRSSVFVIALLMLQTGLLLWHACVFSRHEGPANFYERGSFLAEQVQSDLGKTSNLIRIALPYDRITVPEAIRTSRDRNAATYDYERQVLIPFTNVDRHIGSTLTHVLGQNVDSYKICDGVMQQHFVKQNDLPLARYCRLTATQYIYFPINNTPPDGSMQSVPEADSHYFSKVFEDKGRNLRLYKVRDPLPRVYFARSVKWGKPHSAVLDIVVGAGEGIFNPGSLTILEHNNEAEKGPALSAESDTDSAKAELHEIDPEHLRIDVDTSRSNFLVLADQFYPGWHASIDGTECPIYCANALTRAVLVPSGHHSVEYKYSPQNLIVGLILGGLGLCGICALAGVLLLEGAKVRQNSPHF